MLREKRFSPTGQAAGNGPIKLYLGAVRAIIRKKRSEALFSLRATQVGRKYRGHDPPHMEHYHII